MTAHTLLILETTRGHRPRLQLRYRFSAACQLVSTVMGCGVFVWTADRNKNCFPSGETSYGWRQVVFTVERMPVDVSNRNCARLSSSFLSPLTATAINFSLGVM